MRSGGHGVLTESWKTPTPSLKPPPTAAANEASAIVTVRTSTAVTHRGSAVGRSSSSGVGIDTQLYKLPQGGWVRSICFFMKLPWVCHTQPVRARDGRRVRGHARPERAAGIAVGHGPDAGGRSLRSRPARLC